MAMDNYFFNMYLIWHLFFISDRVCGFGITELKVPVLVDPGDSLELGCVYDMGNEELYSVKWYKDDQEFFRYTPRQQPHVKSFPVAGVHLAQPQKPIECDEQQCTVQLTRLSTAHSSGSYRCEVSTEAPRFNMGFRVANMTVAAVGKTVPQIQGLRAIYNLNELVQAQCIAAAADPQPILTWQLNGARAPATTVGSQRASPPDQHGLITVKCNLRFHAESKYFPPPDNQLHVICVAASPPTVPAPALTSRPAIAQLLNLSNHQQQGNVLSNQKLEWLNSKAPLHKLQQRLLCTMVLITFCFW